MRERFFFDAFFRAGGFQARIMHRTLVPKKQPTDAR